MTDGRPGSIPRRIWGSAREGSASQHKGKHKGSGKWEVGKPYHPRCGFFWPADKALSRLQAEHLLLQETASRIPGQLELRFQSELLRDAALRLVPLSDYPTLHLRIAQWLEQHAPIELSRQIAKHFEAAGNSEAAYSYYLAATELALAEENHPRALELAAHLATLELPLESRAEALLTYAQAALAAGDAALAERQLAQAAQQLAESSPSEHLTHLGTRLRQLAERVAAAATRHP